MIYLYREKKFFTIRDTRAYEDNAFGMGIAIETLMEQAGKAISEEIMNIPSIDASSKIFLFCGFGNNGGDGLVAVRYLTDNGYDCKIVLVGKKETFNSQSSQKNYEKLKNILEENRWFRIKDVNDIPSVFKNISDKDWIVDGLLGIGIKGTPREPIFSIIDTFNKKFKRKVIAIDIPSGYNPESNNSVYIKEPAKIICLGKNKIKTGDFATVPIIVKDIGIPPEAETYIGIGDLKWFLPERESESHKGDNGIVVVIGGSIYYTGAPVLSALGAFRTGADLVYIYTPKNVRSIISSFSPDLITVPGSSDELNEEDAKLIVKDMRFRKATFIIGPGTKKSKKTRLLVSRVLKSKDRRKLVIDAGALSSLGIEELKLLQNHHIIITPHKREFYRVFQIELPDKLEERKKIVQELASEWGVTILLKGKIDIISNGKITKLNATGHPGMTVGGTGDVLTGIIASLFANLEDSFVSACLAAYISGRAGELASKEYGDGLMASDIPHYINKVIVEAKNFVAKELSD
ncbi:MAG: NAD(P)H-hydrate dehydratase [Candidatus Heimdallarchaeum endolithica]|uniref:Bifunctional NAD(P)H-hydrate repair enzyme n=1 Tax=Candidatus Heimdallarchaeum endolithica TaxID=2876572 RepID=A0A9Y1BQU1_9ARCH|nr:MAG: NAD(P)H-hydrate dehydratase [Candidatus Heimdallarchaeum endolithica]